MSTKLYVGGLPYATTEDELKDAFSAVGTVVSAIIIKDKMSGRSKGFGFVEMSSEEEAQKAIDTMNGQQMGERTISVSEARPLEERRPRQSFNRGPGRGDRFSRD